MNRRIHDSIEVVARHLRRAQTEQLLVRRDPDEPTVCWVSSSNIEGHWYRVTRQSCTCPAFRHQGSICKHWALASHIADEGKLPRFGDTTIVNGGAPSLKTRVQAGWISDEKKQTPPAAPVTTPAPTPLYAMRNGTAQPKTANDRDRLAWSMYS